MSELQWQRVGRLLAHVLAVCTDVHGTKVRQRRIQGLQDQLAGHTFGGKHDAKKMSQTRKDGLLRSLHS